MSQTRGTFYLQRVTLKRLQEFSKRTGMPQSALVDQIVSTGLQYLERKWIPINDKLDNNFAADLAKSTDRLARRGKRS